MNKNKRQAYAVNKDAGMQTAAESWGELSRNALYTYFITSSIVTQLCCEMPNRYLPNALMRMQVLDALSPVFLVFQVVVPTVPVRPPSVTCVVEVACSTLPRPGGSGTARSTPTRRGECNRPRFIRNREMSTPYMGSASFLSFFFFFCHRTSLL